MTETPAPVRILFVCTGNTCRSPMAAALFNAAGPVRARAESAGLAARDGEPMSSRAREVLAELGIAAADFRSRRITDAAATAADLIVGLTAAHCREIVRKFPQCADKTIPLAADGDVPDPFGGDAAVYRRCLEQMRPAVLRLAERFN